jgi:hypothetical protein
MSIRPRKVARGIGAVNGVTEAMLVEQGQAAVMVDVGMGQKVRFDLFRMEWKPLISPLAIWHVRVEQPAIHKKQAALVSSRGQEPETCRGTP